MQLCFKTVLSDVAEETGKDKGGEIDDFEVKAEMLAVEAAARGDKRERCRTQNVRANTHTSSVTRYAKLITHTQ